MSNSLPTYLHDHLAGANFAVDLLKALADQNADNALGPFVNHIRVEVEADRAVLDQLIEKTGSVTPTLKEAAAWLVEKASRFKLAWAADRELGTFEALEALSLGVLGKFGLWQALKAVSPYDPRLAGIDFDGLSKRAQEQHSQIEQRRIEVAKAALAPR